MLHDDNNLLKTDKKFIAAIFRIIGNENPPRDTSGRRLQVLEHILKNECEKDNIDKWFILNRIIDIQHRRSLCEILDRYNAKYITIPFDIDHISDDRKTNLRNIININSIRNYAINVGKLNNKYTIVLDGDCMFTEDGLNDVVRCMNDDYMYISIPHRRLISDGVLGDPAEPMVAFHHNSTDLFDENIAFGDGDKLELLYRIGHNKTPRKHHEVIGHHIISSGYVVHIHTGDDQTESDLTTRLRLREESLDTLIEKAKIKFSKKYVNNIKTDSDLTFDYSGQYSGFAFDLQDNSTIVEVGSWFGDSIIYIAKELYNYGKRSTIFCVDTWDGGDDNDLNKPLRNVVAKFGGEQIIFEKFMSNIRLAKIDHMINPIMMRSVDAAKKFSDESIDLIWIDAGHTYDEVIADLVAWYPKVKIGGMIAGHDYALFNQVSIDGVIRAVSEFFKNKNLEIQPYGRTWKHVKYSENWKIFRKRRWV